MLPIAALMHRSIENKEIVLKNKVRCAIYQKARLLGVVKGRVAEGYFLIAKE